MLSNTEAWLAALNASCSCTLFVISWVTQSKDPSSKDGEGEKSVHDVVAHNVFLPVTWFCLSTEVGLLLEEEEEEKDHLQCHIIHHEI